MKKILKMSSSAYRVLLLIKALNENEYTLDGLNNFFYNEPDIIRTFSKEVMFKYLNTLRAAGYKIEKPNPFTYKLLKAPVFLNLSEEELKSLVILENFVEGLYLKRLKKDFDSFMKKITRYLSDDHIAFLNNYRIEYKANPDYNISKYSKYSDLIKQFEQYCIEDQKIAIKYKQPFDIKEKDIIFEPKSIKFNTVHVYIFGYNPLIGEKQFINLDYILEVEQLPVKSQSNYSLSPVTFKLKGRLSKRYRLYENEKIVETDEKNGSITVSAYVEDKNLLIQRLLKYGDLCELIYPKDLRDKMIEILDDALQNYL